MKRALCLAVIALALSPVFSQIMKLDTFIQSSVLDSMVLVDVILPPGYDTSLNTYYPVVYYYHGWTGDQNSNSSIISYMNSYINNEYVDPFILVKPSAWCEPFQGSCYLNSPLWGDYQDFVAEELLDWVDSSFRTVPQKSHRGIIGNSMGSYGCFLVTKDHPQRFRAAAGHGGAGYRVWMKDTLNEILIAEQNFGPPYTYSFNVSSYPWTSALMLFCGAIAPNPNSTQSYVSPKVIDFALDEWGNWIDSTFYKIFNTYPVNSVSSLDPADSVAYLFSCGTEDDWLQFDASEAMVDSMHYYGIEARWLPHSGDHSMPTLFKDRAYRWMDSILGDPITLPNTHIPEPSHFPNISIWPNPATDQLTIQLERVNQQPTLVEFLDMEGRLILAINKRISPGTSMTNIPLSKINNGMYLIHIQTANRHFYRKFIKR